MPRSWAGVRPIRGARRFEGQRKKLLEWQNFLFRVSATAGCSKGLLEAGPAVPFPKAAPDKSY